MAQNNDNSSSSSVSQQIEGTAGYYEPALYQLLTFYSSLSTESEDLDGQFIPLTSVPFRSAQETLIFAVGILPPTSNVTGRLLDRSATVSSLTSGSDTQVDYQTRSAAAVQNVGVEPGVAGENQGPPIRTRMTAKQAATAFRDAYRARFHEDPSATTLAVLLAQSSVETGAHDGSGDVTWPNYNPGYIGNYRSPPSNRDTFSQKSDVWPNSIVYYNTYPDATKGASALLNQVIVDGALDAAKNGDIEAYTQALKDHGYFGGTADQYAKAMGDLDFWKSKVGDPSQLDSNGLPPPLHTQLGGDATPSKDWQGTGSYNANQAQKDASKAANKNLNRTDLGLRYLAQQQAMIKATQAAITRMKNTPPLRMLVNPSSFKIGGEKIISDGSWGRNGPIVEHWGDQQDKLEASGKIAGFYALDVGMAAGAGIGAAGSGPGLGRIARQFSMAYQLFLSLWLLYKSNGGVYLQDYIQSSSSKQTNLSVLGSIYIYYDNILYIGSFDNFNITETETAPFTLEYNFSFSVRATFILDRIDDQKFTYGAPQFFNTGAAPNPQVANNANASPTASNVADQPAPNVPPAPQTAAQQALQEQINTENEQRLFGGG